MLYRIEEYEKMYPEYNVGALAKFKDAPKNLHEMSLDEINAITSEWKPLSENSIIYYQKSIRYYFEWLKSQGVKVDPSIARKIKMPLADTEFLIYSTKDLAYHYDKLFKYVERLSVIEGVEHSLDVYYMCYAAGILSFYGMTAEQIIALTISDVQSTGVIGYDLPLTQADIDVLMHYKNVQRVGVRKPLRGTTYIRSARVQEIDKNFLSRPLRKLKFDEDNEYLKKLLSIQNLYVLGIYNRIYQIEKQRGEQLVLRNSDPKWFTDMFKGIKANVLTPYKKEYIAYREERDNAPVSEPEPIKKVEPAVQPKADYSQLTMRLNNLLTIMRGVCTEIESIREEVNKLK